MKLPQPSWTPLEKVDVGHRNICSGPRALWEVFSLTVGEHVCSQWGVPPVRVQHERVAVTTSGSQRGL